MLVRTIKCENGATSACLQGRVPRLWSSRQAACIDGWATALRSPERQKSIHTKNAHHLQNQLSMIKLELILLFFLLSSFQNKKKTAAFELQGARRAELIAARRCTWSTSLLVLRAEHFRHERFRSCQDFWTFLDVFVGLALILRRQPNFYWDSLVQYRFFEGNSESVFGALSKPIDCLVSKGFTGQFHNFSFEKKNPLVN